MKRTRFSGALLAAAVLAAVPAHPATYNTSFPLTENPISEGGKWVNGKAAGLSWNNIATGNGLAMATHKMLTAPPYDDCIAHLGKSFMTFGNDQYAQGTVHRASGYQLGHEIELLLRFEITANNARGYEVYWSTNGGLYLVRWNGPLNSFNPLYTESPGLANDGDVVRAEVTGSAFSVKINGNTVLTGTDRTFTSGQPGIGLNPYDVNSDMSSYTWSDFEAGDLGTAGESRDSNSLPKQAFSGAGLSVSPNPCVKDAISIKTARPEGSVSIFNASGKVVASFSAHAPMTWNVREPSGVYLARWTQEKGRFFYQRITVIR